MNKKKIPLVAILRGILPHEVDSHISALLEAGFTSIEIPLNSPDWLISIRHAVKHYGQQAQIGAGTVLSVTQVDQLAELGCQLIVTPNTHPGVIQRALHYGMDVLPGCATATEAFTAIDAGARKIKIFPAGAFGPAYVQALSAVIPPEVKIYAVGGVTPENLNDYLQAGCSGAGLGSDLYRSGQSPLQTAQQAAAFIRAFQNSQS